MGIPVLLTGLNMKMTCNICGNGKFVRMNARKAVRCSKCSSLERTRLMALFIQKFDLVNENSKILHIAPEKGLADYLYGIAKEGCCFADLFPANYPFAKGIQKLDLCQDLDAIPDHTYDLIIHSHVLEHLPCNYTYVLYHMHRILKESGRIICSIPVIHGFYDCCSSPELTDEQRKERFGQNDHIRKFGRDDLNMTLGKVYNLGEYDVTTIFSKEELLTYNIPENCWKYYTPGSVLCLSKTDYLLA